MSLSWFGFHFFQISLICVPIILVPLSPHWDRLDFFLRALVLSEEDVNASTYGEFLGRTSLFSMLYKVSTVYLLNEERIFSFFSVLHLPSISVLCWDTIFCSSCPGKSPIHLSLRWKIVFCNFLAPKMVYLDMNMSWINLQFSNLCLPQWKAHHLLEAWWGVNRPTIQIIN